MGESKILFNARTVIKGGLITGFISATFSFIYNVALKQLFLDKGDLVYEQPLITNYKEGPSKFSVANIYIKNNGNFIVEDVTFSVSLNGNNIKCSFEQSSFHIRVGQIEVKSIIDTSHNNIYSIPFLNKTEEVQFQFKVPGYIGAKDLKVELRGKGYTGHELMEDRQHSIKTFYNTLLSFLCMLILMLLYALVKKSQRDKTIINKTAESLEDKAKDPSSP